MCLIKTLLGKTLHKNKKRAKKKEYIIPLQQFESTVIYL